MAYIGKDYKTIKSGLSPTQQAKVVDTMTGNGSATTLSLSTSPGTVNNVRIWIDGVFQTPGTEYTLSGSTITFTTAPFNGAVVLAISGATINVNKSISPKPISISKIANSAVTNDKITALASSKLTGTLPAISGANLTSLPAANLTGTVADARISTLTSSKLSGALPAISGANLTNLPAVVGFDTKNSSDPTITTNPSGGVGHIWVNTTSGKVYVCTDATSNNNVWTNWGGGTGTFGYWQGTQYGYASGGYNGSSRLNTITRYSFTSDGNVSDGGDLTVARSGVGGAKSTTHGYCAGGVNGGYRDIIDRFAFANFSSNATDVGDLTHGWAVAGGHSTESYGYVSGGWSPTNSREDTIEKYQLAASSSGVDVGNLTEELSNGATTQSTSYGYHAGGFDSPPTKFDIIQKFSFASDGNATDVGDLTAGREGGMGVASTTHGYVCGGLNPSSTTNYEKFSFSSNGNGTSVGSLTVARAYQGNGNQSTTHGYCNGGYASSPTNVIDKFSFLSEGTATDVGDLAANTSDSANVSF